MGIQKLSGVRGKFGLRVQNEAGQRLTEFCQENTLVIANTLFQQHKRWLYTWTPDGQYQNQIDYIFFQPKMEKLYTISKNKIWMELDVTQIINTLLQNSILVLKIVGKPLGHSGMTKITSHMIIQWKWQIDSKD